MREKFILSTKLFRDNQTGEEVTVVDQLHIIGTLQLNIYPFHPLQLPPGSCLDFCHPFYLYQESPIQNVMLGLKAAFFQSLRNFRCLKSNSRRADPFLREHYNGH